MSQDHIGFILFLVALVFAITAGILLLVFGEVTVRRLRKEPELKDCLGIEFVSGGSIINVAQALALMRRSGTFGLMPNAELMYRHTTKLDRLLGRSFYWTMIASAVVAVAWVVVVA